MLHISKPAAGERIPMPAPTLQAILDAYHNNRPNLEDPTQRVAFGTSGHRGSSLSGSFTDAHIAAVTQAVIEHRTAAGITGPLYIGKDTHALSTPALNTALEVLAAHGTATCLQADDRPTPTPAVSRAILAHNADPKAARADGIVVTPSHNPPQDGGFKYNEPHGGPAGESVTKAIETRANELLRTSKIKRLPLKEALKAPCLHRIDFIAPYVEALDSVLDMQIIAGSGLNIGVDPLGGSSLPFWEPIAERWKLRLTVVNPKLDPLFSFMPPDHDGKIRMDCSSPWAMAGLINMAGSFDLAFATDPDADRHGIVTPAGLMNPNHYLCAAVDYLAEHRPGHPAHAAVGKTLVTTALMDRVCAARGRAVYETPVGFKWFVDGLVAGTLIFGGEESAGASFLCRNGSAWSTDKDGILLCLLAAEMTARTGKNPAQRYAELTARLGTPYYTRKDAPATAAQKAALKALAPTAVKQKELTGHPITAVRSKAPGNNESIGGIKVETAEGWFAARPSGTEELYKIYAESFISPAHLETLLVEAKKLVSAAFEG